MNDPTEIRTDGKQNIQIKHGSTAYTIEVNRYGVLRIHGEYRTSDGTLEEKTAMSAACVDRQTMDVCLV